MQKYLEFSVEDFLQDEYFVQSVHFPNEETALFWQKYKDSNPKNLKNYQEAITFISVLTQHKMQLAATEADGIWSNISEIRKKRRARKYYVGIASCAAAIFAIMVLLSDKHFSLPPDNNEIYKFAANMDEPDDAIKEIQLFFSDTNKVVLKGQQSEISYEKDSIVAENNTIGKELAAKYNTLQVPRGRTAFLTLSDGTKVVVNSGSRLVFPTSFALGEREIYIDGEIYLDVARNVNSTFIVKTKNAEVKVLGTQFNVKAYAETVDFEVVLVSGSVNILNKERGNKQTITPNTLYSYHEGAEHMEEVDVKKYISWKDGVYIYKNETLLSILNFLSNHYGVEIEVATEIESIKCSGKLEIKESLPKLLQDLSKALKLNYSEAGTGYKITKIY